MMKSSSLMNLLLITMMLILYVFTSSMLHPIYLISLLLLYSILICIILSIWSFNFMFSIMLFLIMISGLLIIFLYFSSLISNEQNKISMNMIMYTNLLMNLMLMLWLMTKFNINKFPFQYSLEYNNLKNLNDHLFTNIQNIYNLPYCNFTFLCMLFLLIALFTIIKICNIKSFSLRKIT